LKYALLLWIHLFQQLYHCWKQLSYFVLGISKSCCVVLSLIISPTLKTFTFQGIFNSGEELQCFLKIFCLFLNIWANRRLQTGSAPSAPLSAAVGQTLLTHVSCPDI
jgi:hypothetical protein